jgi:hypothetical protein
MGKVYKVYDAEKNEFLSTRGDKDQAIGDVDSLCGLDHTTGVYEVHEFDEDDTDLLHPLTVYSRRA